MTRRSHGSDAAASMARDATDDVPFLPQDGRDRWRRGMNCLSDEAADHAGSRSSVNRGEGAEVDRTQKVAGSSPASSTLEGLSRTLVRRSAAHRQATTWRAYRSSIPAA